MNADIFAEWLRRQGHRVVRTESSYWYEASSRTFQAFPYHWVIQPPEAELASLLRQNKAVALRYSAPVEYPVGRISYHAVYEEPDYTLEGLERRSRQNVRTGLANCQVEPISLDRLAREGWLLEMDTSDRQGRQSPFEETSWRQRYQAAADLPGFEAWGALVDGSLVASLLAFQMDDCCELISQQCQRKYLSARVNNALTFIVTQAMVERPEIHSIFYAMQSLDAPPSVDEFKFRMGYRAKAVRQRVVFHPWMGSGLVCTTYKLSNQLIRWPFFKHSKLPKIKGMLQLHITGQLPLSKQNWPECLSQDKETIISLNRREA